MAQQHLSRLQLPMPHQSVWTRLLEGYNTLDALAPVAFSVIAVTTPNQLNFKIKKNTFQLFGLLDELLPLP